MNNALLAFDSKAVAIRILARASKLGLNIDAMGDRTIMILASSIKAEIESLATREHVSVVSNDNAKPDVRPTQQKPTETPPDSEEAALSLDQMLERFRNEWRTVFGPDSIMPLSVAYTWGTIMCNANLGSTREMRLKCLVAVAREAKSKLGTSARYNDPGEAFSRVLSNAKKGVVYGDLRKAFNDIKRGTKAVR